MKCLYLCINTCRSQPDTNIKDKHPENCQSALSAAQILQFNSSTKRRNSETGMYHSRDKETPLPVYVGLLIHGRTLKRELVDMFFQLGLSISYDRVLNISTAMATAAAAQYERDGVVCPFILRKDLFTTAAIDNIDHNRPQILQDNHFTAQAFPCSRTGQVRWHRARAATRGNFSHLESTAYLSTTQMLLLRRW